MGKRKLRLRQPLTRHDFENLFDVMRDQNKHLDLCATISELLEKHAHAKKGADRAEVVEEILEEIVEELADEWEDSYEVQEEEEPEQQQSGMDMQTGQTPSGRRRMKFQPRPGQECGCSGNNCRCGQQQPCSSTCNCGSKNCRCGQQKPSHQTCSCGSGNYECKCTESQSHNQRGHLGMQAHCGPFQAHQPSFCQGHNFGHPCEPFLFRPNHLLASHHCCIPTHVPHYHCDHRIQLRLGGLTGNLNFHLFRAKGRRVKIEADTGFATGTICGVGTDYVDLLQEDKTLVTLLHEHIKKIEWQNCEEDED
ncbi:hypothetical protein CBW65_14240 [Tumebacillus avium]|uniref:Uncharacterized protein n=1 Tax=Tumebacillus avium TaxID=1903704 RepID=A0A1Y0IQC0_9BACL|nr:hypothetical protein [Tumebacillus avium]ARU62036.1 hypothetical protein CBW65_14240 [Tumebacillus avium]